MNTAQTEHPSSSLAASLPTPCLPLPCRIHRRDQWCLPTQNCLGCGKDARYDCICLESYSSWNFRSEKPVCAHWSKSGMSTEKAKWGFLSSGGKEIWKNFRKASMFSWLFNLSHKATLGALSVSEWETCGFHFYCNHIWVSEWWRKKNSGFKASKMLWKQFRTLQAISGCLPPSQIWGLFGWVTDLLKAHANR